MVKMKGIKSNTDSISCHHCPKAFIHLIRMLFYWWKGWILFFGLILKWVYYSDKIYFRNMSTLIECFAGNIYLFILKTRNVRVTLAKIFSQTNEWTIIDCFLLNLLNCFVCILRCGKSTHFYNKRFKFTIFIIEKGWRLFNTWHLS